VIQGQKGPIARQDFWADPRVTDKFPVYKKLQPLMDTIEPDFSVANFRGEEVDNAYAQSLTTSSWAIPSRRMRRPRSSGLCRTFWTKIRRSAMGPRRREALAGYLFLTPWAVGFLIFIAGPMLASALL
jgi:hypothetical protein